MDPRIGELIKRGVRIRLPETVEVGAEVALDAIAPGVELHPGCRIRGGGTAILAGVILGEEAPVTVEECQIGPGVQLKGGYFRRSTFLENANLGSGAQVREGCLLEEEANGAHAVAIKQTILFPFVTLGSLINFCDVLMAGGTSRRDHSEVGSSYVHFNFTPNQDKATASLIGDVPRGVMLRERPIFLGGQGGLVGPSSIGYGSVIAAGIVYRGDLRDGRLATGGAQERKETDFVPRVYPEIAKRLLKNLRFIGNLVALREWYVHARAGFLSAESGLNLLRRGALEKIGIGLDERIARLRGLAKNMPESIRAAQLLSQGKVSPEVLAQQSEFSSSWPAMEDALHRCREDSLAEEERGTFLELMAGCARSSYLETIRNFSDRTRAAGTAWLQNVVDSVVQQAAATMPSILPAP